MNIQNEWAEVSLRAQRAWGKMLETTELAQGKRTDLVPSGNQVTGKPTLADLDTTKKESHQIIHY